MAMATWLFRVTFKSNDGVESSECTYAKEMNLWFNGNCVLALLTILLEYAVAMHFGSRMEKRYHEYCIENSVSMYSKHGKSKHEFGRDQTSYTIDPRRSEQSQRLLIGEAPIEVNQLEPCSQTIATKRVSNALFAYVLIDLAWVIFGLVTVILATIDECYDTDSSLYGDATFILVLSFVLYLIRSLVVMGLCRFGHYLSLDSMLPQSEKAALI